MDNKLVWIQRNTVSTGRQEDKFDSMQKFAFSNSNYAKNFLKKFHQFIQFGVLFLFTIIKELKKKVGFALEVANR